MNEELTFSIVICTYNRDEFLERTLQSLNNLEYSNFELIVVNGPSTDRTSQILDTYKERIKVRTNSQANLSISRNIGIKAAAGDVVAFLDDDAIPEPNWLHQIKEVYEEYASLGGAGGRVYGPGGDHFQFHNGYIDVWGVAEVKLEQPGLHIAPISDKYNIMMGVNSTFLRKALLEVGGFDEYYEYYHDESDVCVRLAKAGYPVYHHQEAYVHHEFARSHIRKSSYNLNWFPIVKNTVYFGVKNAKGIKSISKRMLKPIIIASNRAREFKHWLRNELITKEDYRRFMKMWRKGLVKGYLDGFFKARTTNYNLQNDEPFMKFRKVLVALDEVILGREEPTSVYEIPQDYGICLLSKYYPPFGNGGVATYTKFLAESLVKMGHPVYVLTGEVPGYRQIINGVVVEQVEQHLDEAGTFSFLNDSMPVTGTNVHYAMRVAQHVEKLYHKGLIHVVETPLWDYEGLVCTQIEGLKTIVRLETPLRKAAEMQGWKWNRDLELSAKLETKLLEQVDGIITISNNVKDTIAEMYQLEWKHPPQLVPLGLMDDEFELDSVVSSSEHIKILFVGRLEPRKGIDILLSAFKMIADENNSVELIVAGNNNIMFKNNLTAKEIFEKNANEKIKKRVRFLGEVNHEELEMLYRDCDIFVAPSRYESFGLVYLEAMKYLKPVVGSDVGGIPEVIQHGINGMLVEVENIKHLAETINLLVNNKGLRTTLGKNGGEILKTKFTTRAMALNTLRMYEGILIDY